MKKIPIGQATCLTDVPRTLTVDGFKTKIREREHDLAHVDADQLTIFQCTDPSIDLSCDEDDAGDEEMVLNKLEKVFSNKNVKRLGVRETIASLQLDPPNDILIVQVSGALHATSFVLYLSPLPLQILSRKCANVTVTTTTTVSRQKSNV
jgi:hypothetical protein